MSLYSYDLWVPPVWAVNYWTSYTQYRALKHGAYVGRKIGRGEDASDFESRASLILDYLQERYRLSIFLVTRTEASQLCRHFGTTRMGGWLTLLSQTWPLVGDQV